jgi:hypothetical protein
LHIKKIKKFHPIPNARSGQWIYGAHALGDEALIGLYRKENYHAVATDDAKLVRQLRVKGIPFILPGLIIYQFMQNILLKEEPALSALMQLSVIMLSQISAGLIWCGSTIN